MLELQMQLMQSGFFEFTQSFSHATLVLSTPVIYSSEDANNYGVADSARPPSVRGKLRSTQASMSSAIQALPALLEKHFNHVAILHPKLRQLILAKLNSAPSRPVTSIIGTCMDKPKKLTSFGVACGSNRIPSNKNRSLVMSC